MNKALSAMGLARRAGKLNWGYDTVVEAMKTGACCLVIIAGDLSDKTKKNVRFEAERSHVQCIETAFSMEEISAAIGRFSKTPSNSAIAAARPKRIFAKLYLDLKIENISLF